MENLSGNDSKIEELINTYGSFDDSICSDIHFFDNEKKASVIIYCFNKKKNHYENIKIDFLNVLYFVNSTDLLYASIFIEKRENSILFDFDPIDHFDFLTENPQSECKIVCENIHFEIETKPLDFHQLKKEKRNLKKLFRRIKNYFLFFRKTFKIDGFY